MATYSLTHLRPGQSATIAALHLEASLHHRFQALGFRCGQEVHLLRTAALDGPLHLRIGTTEVMLRRQDAQQIQITPPGLVA